MKQSEMKVASDALFALLATGPKNSTTNQIAAFLRDGDEAAARRLYEWDGDKIAMTVYQPVVQKFLGCRLHGKHDCDAFFCRADKELCATHREQNTTPHLREGSSHD